MSIQSDIRFDKIRVRSLKTTYKYLSANEKKIAKICEAIELTSKEIDRCWKVAYLQGYCPVIKKDLPILDTIALLFNQREKNQLKLTKLETKLNIDSEVIMCLHQQFQSRLYSGSF